MWCSPPDFFLWGLVKDQVYMASVRDLSDLQVRIYAAVNIVTPQILQNTWVEVECRLDISRAIHGSHVEVSETCMYVEYSARRQVLPSICTTRVVHISVF